MEQETVKRKRTTCPLDCPDSCGMIAEVIAGKIESLGGDRSHPYSRGSICRKMRRYPERLYSDQRILYPLQRTGKKGSADFKRISWAQAYEILVLKINEVVQNHGGEAILPFAYAGNMGAVNRFAGYPLFHKLGASQLLETICSAAAGAGWKSQCGDIPGCSPDVAEDAGLIVIWGSNTKVTNMHFWPYVVAARKKGGKLVVVDPYRNATAQSADVHLRVAPGGDAALALGVLKALIANDRINRDYISHCCSGFAALEEYLQQTPWEMFEGQSALARDRIEFFAELFSENPGTFIRLGIGMTRNSRAGLSIRAICSLAAALALFDGGKGRGVLLSTTAFKGDREKLTHSALARKKTRSCNMVQLGNFLLQKESPVKMFFVYNANPLSVTPDSGLVRQALEKEDLFTVVHEQVLTPTAQYADLVLPATTFLENSDIYTGYGHFYLSVTDPVIAPMGEAKSNFDFFQELARKMGYTDSPFLQSIEERMDDYLSSLEGVPVGVTRQDIAAGGVVHSTRCNGGQSFFSPENRFRFSGSEDPALPGFACLLSCGEFEDPDYQARFPLRLITPPHRDLLNSTFGERYQGNLGEVLIHPEDALDSQVKEGDIVTLYNNRGKAKRVARISDATQKGLLVAEGIFWQTVEYPVAVNDLTSQKLTDMGNGGTFHESRVAIAVDSSK